MSSGAQPPSISSSGQTSTKTASEDKSNTTGTRPPALMLRQFLQIPYMKGLFKRLRRDPHLI
jgi:hypothetical protein